EAAFGILIARTGPDKHRGISYFICPMDAPGITIRPIVEMTGAHTFNEVFLHDVRIPAENIVGEPVDGLRLAQVTLAHERVSLAHTFNEVFLGDVRIPAANIVGEPGDGWRLAKVTLANERVSLSSGGALWGMGPSARDLIDLVREAGGVDDPVLRSRLVDLHIESEILRLIRLRTVSAAVRGEAPGPEASIRKVLADEHGQHVFELAKDLAGAHGMLTDGGPLGRPVGVWHHGFLFSRALTIGGGTAEVQRNIIGERVLGLPPEPDVEAPRPAA